MAMPSLVDPELAIDWDTFFAQQAIQSGQHGGGYFQGQLYQRGHGLGNIFRGIFRLLMPVAKSVVKNIGKEAIHTGFNIASDTLHGQDIKEAAKVHGRKAVQNLLTSAQTHLADQSGKGIKRKAPSRKKPVKLGIVKKQKKGDLFDNDYIRGQ